MKRVGLYAIVLLIAGATLALNVPGVFADAGNASCLVNETCSENCTCSDKENCTENCTCLNESACAQYGCNYQNCSLEQNASGIESCPIAGSSAQAGCGTAGKGCPVSLPSKGCGAAR